MASNITSRYISRRLSSSGKILSEEEKAAENIYIKGLTKRIGQGTYEWAAKVDEFSRGMLGPPGSTLFEELGLYYIGPVDGHNIDDLLCVLNQVASLDSMGPVLIHIVTKEDHGEEDDQRTEIFDEYEGGMAEQHAVTFSAGLSRGGLKPFCTIPSAFLQRAYDQVVHDVDRQNIPVRFAITSAGLVGSDGSTHCGAFDITFMSCLPNMIVMAPSDQDDLVNMIATAAKINDRPVCFRYPRGAIVNINNSVRRGVPLEIGKGRILKEGKDVAFFDKGLQLTGLKTDNQILSHG